MTVAIVRSPSISVSHKERQRRKRYLYATLITCISLAMIGGSLHVVRLGAVRMEDMRQMASYDLKEEKARIRAAGEDIMLHEQHEAGTLAKRTYTPVEAEELLTREQWETLGTMVMIPAGPFVMGTNNDRADDQDKPAHEVNLPAYAIDKYLVTNAQYARFVAATGHRPPLNWKDGKIPRGETLRPVTMVTWYDASAYAKWAHKRLPTEAEFEKAGRGTDQRRWPWGNGMDPTRLNTYYNVGSASNVDAFPKGASPYGVLDLSGNVDEWTANDFLPYPNSHAPAMLFRGKVNVAGNSQDQEYKVSEQQLVNRSYKVLRGGSWKGDPFATALYHRDYAFANYASDFFGFRCASDIKTVRKTP